MLRQKSDQVPELGQLSSELLSAAGQLVRKEVELARVELTAELKKGLTTTSLLGVGAVSALASLVFASFAAAWALSLVIPIWAGFLVVAAVFGGPALLLLVAGLAAAKKFHPVPVATITSVKENIAWIRRRARGS